MSQALRARILSRLAHRGQTDKAGQPYYKHPVRVAANIRSIYGGLEQADTLMAVAYLHDVLEDTKVTDKHMRWFGINDEVRAEVAIMTRAKGEHRHDYLRRIRASKSATAVKLADIQDNSDPKRLAVLEPDVRSRLERKYDESRLYLLKAVI
jgi:(p)ppGpp synthase/HD superfamily hydrolase